MCEIKTINVMLKNILYFLFCDKNRLHRLTNNIFACNAILISNTQVNIYICISLALTLLMLLQFTMFERINHLCGLHQLFTSKEALRKPFS